MEWFYSKKTTNQSFIDMWRYLQRNHVYNNIFMLRTYHKELVDFTMENYMELDRDSYEYETTKKLIVDEVRKNIWFYFRELVYLPSEEEGDEKYIRFQLNPVNMMMIYLYDNQFPLSITVSNEKNIRYSNTYLYLYHKEILHTDLLITSNYRTFLNSSYVMLMEEINKAIYNSPSNFVLGTSGMVAFDDVKENSHIMKKYSSSSRLRYDAYIEEVEKKIKGIKEENNTWLKKDIGIFGLDGMHQDGWILSNLISYVLECINTKRKIEVNMQLVPIIPRLYVVSSFLDEYRPTSVDSFRIWYQSVKPFINQANNALYDLDITKPQILEQVYLIEESNF